MLELRIDLLRLVDRRDPLVFVNADPVEESETLKHDPLSLGGLQALQLSRDVDVGELGLRDLVELRPRELAGVLHLGQILNDTMLLEYPEVLCSEFLIDAHRCSHSQIHGFPFKDFDFVDELDQQLLL